MLFSIAKALALSTLVGSSFAAHTNNVPVDSSTIDELYAAALEEDGYLVVASGADAGEQNDGITSAWAARFPKIALNLTGDLSKYHDSRIDRDHWLGKDTVDVVIIQTLHDFPRWKEQGRLMYYKPPTFDDLYSGEKDLDGAFLPMQIWKFGRFIYDRTKVAEADVPTNYMDLLDPKWKGKIVITQPNDDDAITYLFSLIIERYGFEWFEKLMAQDPQWVRGTATPGFVIQDNHNNVTASASGTSPAGRVLGFSGYPPSSADYIKIAELHAPEQHMSWAQTMAAFSSTTRPKTAKLFMAWITSDEYQKATTEGSPRKSLDIAGTVYNSNTTQISQYRVFMNDRARVEWWRLQFDTALGPPVGPNPNLLYP